jgi:hypothetical protein
MVAAIYGDAEIRDFTKNISEWTVVKDVFAKNYSFKHTSENKDFLVHQQFFPMTILLQQESEHCAQIP